jgi:hypothetical protein
MELSQASLTITLEMSSVKVKSQKRKVDVYSFELLAYRALINPDAEPYTKDEALKLPEYFRTCRRYQSDKPRRHPSCIPALDRLVNIENR